MEDSFKASLVADIHQLLPNLSADIFEQLLDKLAEVAESGEDLVDLEEKDLQPPEFEAPLKLLHARKLVRFWHKKYGGQVESSVASEAAPSATAAAGATSQHPPPSMDYTAQWLKTENFDQASMSTSVSRVELPHDGPTATLKLPAASSLSTPSSVLVDRQQGVQGNAQTEESELLTETETTSESTPSNRDALLHGAPNETLMSAEASSRSSASSVLPPGQHGRVGNTLIGPTTPAGPELTLRSPDASSMSTTSFDPRQLQQDIEDTATNTEDGSRTRCTSTSSDSDSEFTDAKDSFIEVPVSPAQVAERNSSGNRETSGAAAVEMPDSTTTDDAKPSTTPNDAKPSITTDDAKTKRKVQITVRFRAKDQPSGEPESPNASSLSTAPTETGVGTSEGINDTVEQTSLSDLGTPESTVPDDDVPNSGNESEGSDEGEDPVPGGCTAPVNGRRRSNRIAARFNGASKKDQEKKCSKTYKKKGRRLLRPASVVFQVMVPPACRAISLCLHEPHSAIVKIPMERKHESKHMFSCKTKVDWYKVGYHYIAEGKKTETEMSELSVNGPSDQQPIKRGMQHQYDNLTHLDLAESKNFMQKGWEFIKKPFKKNESELPKPSAESTTDGMLSSIEWPDPEEWYEPLLGIFRYMESWTDSLNQRQQFLTHCVRDKVQMLMTSGQLTTKDRLRVALALITLERREIIATLDDYLTNFVFTALLIKSPEDICIKEDVNQRLFHDCLQRFIESKIESEAQDTRWLTCLPVLRLLDADHDEAHCMPQWWNTVKNHARATFMGESWNSAREHIRPILRVDKLTTLALLSLMNKEQLSCILPELPPDMFLDAVVLLVKGAPLSADLQMRMLGIFDSQMLELKRTSNSTQVITRLRSASRTYNSAMGEAADLKCKVILAELLYKLYQESDRDIHIGEDLDEMITVGILPALNPSSQTSLHDTIEIVNHLWTAEFVAQRNDLKDHIKDHLNRSINMDDPQQTIAVYGEQRRCKTLHPVLLFCLREHAKSAITESLKTRRAELVFDACCFKESTVDLFTEIFQESWISQHPLKHLLTWPHLNLFMGNFIKLPRCDETTACLHTVKHIIENVLKSIAESTITVDDMKWVLSQRDFFIPQIKNSNAWNTTIPNITVFNQYLHRRKSQICMIEQINEELDVFTDRCHQARYKNTDSLHQFAPERVIYVPIGNLCKDADDQSNCYTTVRFHDMPEEVVSILPFIKQVEEQNAFDRHFDKLCERLGTRAINDKSLAAFARDVIGAALNEWEQIRADMTDGSVSFKSIKNLFGSLSLEEMRNEFHLMHIEDDIITERLRQVRGFFQLLQYQRATESIMALKRTYSKQFTGDFNVLQKVTEMDESAKLSSITGETESIMGELEALDNEKLEWLDKYNDAHPLVTWLQEELVSLQEVETLMDLQVFTASSPSGYEMSKVFSFLKVVKAFSPLIYDLPECAGLRELLEALKQIWATVDSTDGKLPDDLIDLKNELEWLKDLKEKQSGVGRDALSTVKKINSDGIYTVGNLSGNTKDLDQMITVTLPTDNGEKELYTYSNLQDLQSTLTLAAGENEASRQDAQYFSEILNAVRGVAEAFAQLCDEGNILFGDWKSDFFCNEEKDVNTFVNFGLASGILAGRRTEGQMLYHIKQVREFMQDCLDDWAKHIQEQRKRFPVLNSFTTKQIIILRSQLSKISDIDRKEPFPNKIYPMLQMILPGCTEKELKEAWVNTVRQMESMAEEMPQDEDRCKSEEEEVIRNLQEKGLHRDLIIRAMRETESKDEDTLMLWCWKREDDASDRGTVDSTAIQKEETLGKIMGNIISSELTENKKLKDRLNSLWKRYLSTNTAKSLKDYLSVVHLGHMLTFLKGRAEVFQPRKLPAFFHKGRPNLLLCEEAKVWKTVLSTYMKNSNLPLPTRDEVLLCTRHTSVEDVQLLLMRASQNMDKIFMLLKIDQLPYKVAQQVQCDMWKILQGCPDYSLVVICCKERQDKSILVPALYSNHIETFITYKTEEIRAYIKKHLQTPSSQQEDRLSVNIIQSQRAGVGKTLWVRNHGAAHPDMRFVGLPLHGKTVNIPGIVERMCEHTLPPNSQERILYHVDIPHEMNMGVDQLLFELIILRSLSDPKGYMWARSEHDFYDFETMPLQSWEVQSGVTADEARQPVHHMLELLPTITCHTPQDCLHIMNMKAEGATQEPAADGYSDNDMLMDEGRFRSEPFQRVYQFLLLLKENKDLDSINPQEVKGDMIHCLETLLEYADIDNPSWAELNYFVQFLNIQWCQYEESTFCKLKQITEEAYKAALEEAKRTGRRVRKQDYEDNLPGLSKFAVRTVLQMSKDFVGRSLHITDEIARHAGGQTTDPEDLDREEIEKYELTRKWKASANPYVFFNPDGHSMSFIGYHVDQATMNLLDPQTKQCLVEKIMDKQLYQGLRTNKVVLEEDLNLLPREQQLQKLCTVMGVDYHDPDPSYVLTSDNLKKMLAIYMRFRCQIPVIVMGESGCGKTYLVNFLCRLQKPQDEAAANITNRFVLKIHGSVSEKDIIEKIRLAEAHAKENHKRYPGLFTVVFLDEVNTTEALSLVKEILCDHTINGEHLDMDSGLRFVAACNPYKMHSKEMIKKMEDQGLGYHVPSTDDRIDRFGRTPKRHLVYRVEPMPQSLLFLVWDFGQLSDETEALYIRKIVHRHLRTTQDFTDQDKDVITDILHSSQCYMRSRKDECSHVSLRDPERAMVVMKWFLEKKSDLFSRTVACDNVQTWSLIMALGVCYHAALGESRQEYREHIISHFRDNFRLDHSVLIAELIERCQDKFIDSMRLDQTIAKNEALKENIFMMAVCIELRIPLFIIGKPGSSKTLSRQILANEMKGRSSHSKLYKNMKEVRMTVYQCSPLSTAEGIIAMFRTCATMQENNDLRRFVSVVVLDEVGLAEDTPEMPLKTLHHLLEHDREGEEVAEPKKKVGFLGLSNWSLDPAKNNRALMVRRTTPDAKSLIETAEALCKGRDQRSCRQLTRILPAIAQGYFDLYTAVMEGEGQREFFGLRDFYSMVKMLLAFARRNDGKPTNKQIRHAILRNFGGLPDFNPLEFFSSILETRAVHDDDSRITDMIHEALDNKEFENRHLLLLTENQAALHIIQERFDVLRNAVIIFGSSFPDDLEFTQLCRAINRVKLCMENGETVILLNQQPIFESLYDALNQYYTYFSRVRHVDIGLGSKRIKCKVHEDFRLVVVADRETVLKEFPIPLINRFEKHYLATSTILNLAQQDIIKDLNRWIEDFTKMYQGVPTTLGIRRGRPRATRPGDIFIGYHKEAPAAITLQVCKELGKDEGNKTWKEKVLSVSKERLLLAATPESIVLVNETGLKDETNRIQEIYLQRQQHESLLDYFRTRLAACGENEDTFTQITTHSQLLPIVEDERLERRLQVEAMIFPMEAFTTVQEFSDKLRLFYDSKSSAKDNIFIVQCSAGDRHQELLACCRYIITEEHHRTATSLQAAEAPQPENRPRKHVVLVVQLPRLAGGCFTGFQMQPWECIHIDELHSQHQLPPIYSLLKGNVSSAIGDPDNKTANAVSVDRETLSDREHEDSGFQQLFESCIIPAMSILRDETEDAPCEEGSDRKHANISRMDKLNNLLQGMPKNERRRFLGIMRKRIYLLQCEREEKYENNPGNWLSKVARNNTEMKMLTLGTHVRNYIREKMTALVAGIVAFADRNSNLDILQEEGWKKTMWFDMLSNEDATRLSIEEDLGQSEPQEIPVKSHGAGGGSMKVKLPFSWVFYQQIDACMEQERKVHSRTAFDAALAVPEILSRSPMWEILVSAISDDRLGLQTVIRSYLQDFVAMVYKAQTAEKEYEHQLVQEEIYRQYIMMSVGVSDAGRIPLIHAAYEQIQGRIELFLQIVQRCPEVVENMKNNKAGQSADLNLELQAVQRAMQIMQPTKDQLRQMRNCQKWYETTGKMAPLINQAFSTVQHEEGEQDDVSEHIKLLMNEWERIITVRMFASIVCPPGSVQEKNMIRYCPLLWLKLQKANMKTAHTLSEVDKILRTIGSMQESESQKEGRAQEQAEDEQSQCPGCGNRLTEVFLLPCKHENCIPCLIQREETNDLSCLICKQEHPESTQLQKQLSRSQQKLRNFKNSLQSFRMELVSRLCLPGPTPPEDELINLLLCNLTAPCAETEDMVADRMTKTVLLQLLMISQPDRVRRHLDLVLSENPEQPEQGPLRTHHLNLAILYVQHMEDNGHIVIPKGQNDLVAIREIARNLEQCFEALTETGLNVQRLEAIALTRFCLSETANWLEKIYIQELDADQDTFVEDLLPVLQELCTGENLSWPRKYLLKLLVRRFSLDTALAISNKDEMKWLMDSELRTSNGAMTEPDPFILYGDSYKAARRYLATALTTGDLATFNTWLLNNARGAVDHLLMLTVSREVRQRNASSVNQRLMNTVRDTGQIIQKELLQKLLNDSLAVSCDKLRLSAHLPDAKDRVLRDLLLHLYITMRDSPTVSLLEPFKRLVHKPAEMKEKYLPTMPQDRDFEALQAVRATGFNARMYACQNGHRYTITECGRPNQRSTCPVCGAPIGSSGRMHQLAPGNTEVSLEDQTKKGHILGAASAQPSDVVPERKLSLLQSNIIRLLLHLSMYLGANGNLEGTCSLIDPAVPVNNVSDFLWHHLHHDLNVLTQTMSIDDVVLLIHTIIIKMTEFTDVLTNIQDPLLTTKQSRGQWEDCFTFEILGPILNRQEEVLQEAHSKVMSDDTLGISKLLQMVYEAEEDNTDDRDPVNMAVMWRYRVNVTFQTAAQRLAELRCGDDAEQGEGAKHELLHFFMQHESAIRDVQLLPRIIKFHKLLLQKYNHKITQKKANDTRIGRFLQGRKRAGDEECEELFRDYQRVWDSEQSRLTRQEPSAASVGGLQKSTALSRLLPTSYVLKNLVKTHNNLIQHLERARFGTCNLGPDVNLLDVNPTHLVMYDPDKDLLPLVTANCSSSLLVGQGTKVKYDFDKMEYQLTEHLCEGKSRIVNTEISMVFSDSLTAVRKLEKLEAKIKQVPFKPEIAAELYRDAGFAADVYELVANLDTAIGFLHTVGGKPNRLLGEFMREDLRMEHVPLPSRTQKHCQLQHVKALWLFMSNEREKHAAKLDAVPFSTLTEDGHSRFRDPLEDDQMDALQDCLAHADLEKLLMELFTCITLYIINLDDACDVDAPLIYHLMEMEDVEVAAAALQLPDEVPAIRVSQCMAAWRAIYDYSQDID